MNRFVAVLLLYGGSTLVVHAGEVSLSARYSHNEKADFDISAKPAAAFFSYYEGRKYDFAISDVRLAKTPVWQSEDSSPLLSPRKAGDLATGFLPKLVADPARWKIKEITLTPVGPGSVWIYVVEIVESDPPGAGEGRLPKFNIPVLMDGTVVQPSITDGKLAH